MQDTPARDAERLTFVLVHGAFHGGWCWKGLEGILRDMGHTVFRPTLTGLGERAHLAREASLATFVTDILNVLRYEELDNVILVGHSFGGLTISGVADICPERLRHLVYYDALILRDGETAASMSPPAHHEHYRETALDTPLGRMARPRDTGYFGINEPDQAERFNAMLTPQPLSLHEEPVTLRNPPGNGVGATYIACTRPRLAATAASRRYARDRTDWQYLELDTPHNGMMTDPVGLARVLGQIAARPASRQA